MSNLHTVHQAISKAVDRINDKPNPEIKLQTRTFRADEDKTELAVTICKRHGISLGAFIRECIEGLVVDYTQPTSDIQHTDI